MSLENYLKASENYQNGSVRSTCKNQLNQDIAVWGRNFLVKSYAWIKVWLLVSTFKNSADSNQKSNLSISEFILET